VNILHILHSLDPRSGGPSNALRGLVRAQVARGHRVAIVATTAQSAEPWAPRDEFVARMLADPAFAGAEVLIGRAWGRRRPWSRFSYCPHTIRLLARRLASPETRPEVVHIHGAFSHLTIRAAQLARQWRIPYIVRPAGSFDEACLAKGMAQWKRVFLRLFHRRDLRLAAAVHVTSQAEAEHLGRTAPGCRLAVVPHGVELPDAPLPEQVEAFLSRFPQLRGKRVVLFLSRLHEKKRPQWLVEAFCRLRHEMPNLALVLAGPDAGLADGLKLRAQAAGLNGQAVLPGFVQGPDKAAAFSLAHVFCLPSQDENFGVAVVEAMAHGVPVVVTPGVASHVYVDAAGCGLTVADDLDGLTEGLRRLLRSDRAELGRRGRQYVEKHLTWPAVADQLDALYRTVGQAPRA
jgi:glycosyltransferase involved in cell wall biosynthesis